MACQTDLTVANVQFLQLHVFTIEIRRVSQDHHGISITPLPLDVNPMLSCMVDDSIEDIVGRHGEDPCPYLLKRKFDGISLRDSWTGHHGDYRLDSTFFELKSQDDPIHLEKDAGIMDLRGQLIGEVGDQILGQPGVDLLIGEDRLPRMFVADIVAQLQALGDEMLGLDLALLVRKADDRAIIGGLVRQGEPDRRRDKNADSKEGSRPDEPLGQHLEHQRTHLFWKGQSDGKRPAHGGVKSGCRLRGLTCTRGRTNLQHTNQRKNGQPGVLGQT
jgi:hypothetical protein